MTCNHKQLDEVMMAAALAEACASVASGGMPFGAVLVVNDEIASRGYNRQIQDGRFLAHAEMECLESFYRANSDVALNGATLIATEAPCPMCAGAAVIAGISRIVIGEAHHYQGALEWLKVQDIELTVLNDPDCIGLVEDFKSKYPDRWSRYSAG